MAAHKQEKRCDKILGFAAGLALSDTVVFVGFLLPRLLKVYTNPAKKAMRYEDSHQQHYRSRN